MAEINLIRETVDYNNTWLLINKIFPILDDEAFDKQSGSSAIQEEEFIKVTSTLNVLGLGQTIQDMIINKIEQYLRREFVPTFWQYFRKSENANGFIQFFNAVKYFYDVFVRLDVIMPILEMLRDRCDIRAPIYNENCVHSALKLICRATLLSQLPVDHQHVVLEFYESALKMADPNDATVSEGLCVVCLQNTDTCNCGCLFYETNRKLGAMGLLEPLAGQVLTNLIYTYVYAHIQKLCKDSFDTSYIGTLEKWLDDVVINWLKKIYYSGFAESAEKVIDVFDKKLVKYLYNAYVKIRIDQLFNIIIEHPESLPALDDVRLCLPKTDLKSLLIKKLQKAMETRLLHPGVSTPDILTAYVATIRSLRVLDPSGLLLETVTQPIHQYLRSREDTVRCVVSSLTEEGSSDLAEEFSRGEVIQFDENTPVEENTENWDTWTPDPVDAATSKATNACRSIDIISMLVNVYGSKELFVNEYRTLLADRLLSQHTCDTEKEIRYLELLKLRFGDSQLHYCEVMLKDIADSKRINQHIHEDAEYEEYFPFSVLMLSEQFWPPFKEEEFKPHDYLVEQAAQYTTSFQVLKGNRTLQYKFNLGFVDLEIELGERVLNLSVNVILATVLQHFSDKSKWALSDLSTEMKITPTALRKKLAFWQSHGVITEIEPDMFCLASETGQENAAVADQQTNIVVDEDSESESTSMASAQDQHEEDLQTFWSYIVGMLTNLDTLPLERIHQMLKMFAFHGPTIECSVQELKKFLDKKVREHHLIYSNGLYSLPK